MSLTLVASRSSYENGPDLDTYWTGTSRPVVASSTCRALNGAFRCTRTRSLHAGDGDPDVTMPTSLMLTTVADSLTVTWYGVLLHESAATNTVAPSPGTDLTR